jgi:hypothetical protein
MQNAQVTGKSSFRAVFRCKYFLRGYADVVKDRGWNPDYDNWYQGHQWQYERGRQYAVATDKALPPKVRTRSGKIVLNNAGIYQLRDLYCEGSIL